MAQHEPAPLKKSYIAYFDILGYRQFFKENPEKVQAFLSTIDRCIVDFIEKTKQSNISLGMLSSVSLNYKIFSDNVLVCLEPPQGSFDDIGFIAFISIVGYIQDMFVNQYGLFIRGGITFDSISLNDNYVFGSGLIRAVDLESRAKMPRIIIDERLRSAFEDKDDIKTASVMAYNRMLGAAGIENPVDDSQTDQLAEKAINHACSIEILFRKLRNSIIRIDLDGEYIVDYLNEQAIDEIIIEAIDNGASISENNVLDEIIKYGRANLAQSSEQRKAHYLARIAKHREVLVEKIQRYGNYADISLTEKDYAKCIQERQKVICKYKWATDFHNIACHRYGYPQHIIYFAYEDTILMSHEVLRVLGIRLIDRPPCSIPVQAARELGDEVTNSLQNKSSAGEKHDM